MGDKYILKVSNVSTIFYSVKGIFEDLVNKPVVNTYGQIAYSDNSTGNDLEVANKLLGTLEELYGLRVGRDNSSPMAHGFETSGMLKDYIQVKHWQQMLNLIYGDKAAKLP